MMCSERKHVGFTLIELLIVISIFSTIGVIAVGILVASLRGANKTNVLTAVKQNGDFVISQIAKSVRDARGLNAPFPCGVVATQTSTVTITDIDGNLVTFSCDAQNISSNSAPLLDPNAVSLNSCTFSCSQASASDYPVININFSLSQQNSSTFAEQTASASAIPFQTSVMMRNMNR